LLLPALALGQDAADASIKTEYAELLEYLKAPEGVELSEEASRQRAELFRVNLNSFIRRWIERRSELKTGRLILGKALAMAGRPQEAMPHLSAYFDNHKNHEDYEDGWVTLATTALDARDLPRAESLFSQFLAERAESDRRSVVRYYLGLTRAQLGDPDGAVALLDEVAAAGGEGPLEADAAIKGVEILYEWGRTEEARTRLGKLLQQDSEAPYLRALEEQLTWIGKPAPEWVDMVSFPVGSSTSIGALRGKVIVISFFADKYEACKEETVALQSLARRLDPQLVHFQVLTRYYRPTDKVPASEQDAGFKQLWSELKVDLPLGVSTSFDNLRAYGVRGIPHVVVVGKDGRIAYVKTGISRRNSQGTSALEAAIKRAL
jgi:tetratricopeptide (TPR) repeat protein